ncbi:hypothetical protein MLD38_019483 [Melastoma candidum]|uniref:Uncharacterized protein n=1 Tax=Melastoma candidum TaxID=119954 RepID=A0ACB9QX52_9MYRT|nr:hypothetical protein MLD38_019483 [Melastoma candidum]
MASSQVQIPSLSPFAHVLKDRSGRQDGFVEPDKASMTNQDTFHRKLKTLVRDHLPAIISDAAKEPQRMNDLIDPWFVKECRTGCGRSPVKRDGECTALTPTQARVVDRWASQQAREMVSAIEKHAHAANHLFGSDQHVLGAPLFTGETSPSQSSDNSTKGASSLVQMWEARLSQPTGSNNSTNSPRCCSRTISPALSCPENAFHSPREETLASPEAVRHFNEELSADWEFDGTTGHGDPSPTFKSQDLSASDTERGRVANIIKRLTSKGDQHENAPSSPTANSLYRERERASPNDLAVVGQKPFLQATSSPRIRGRQAFSDLLMQMERDRHKELESLSDRRAVSRFSQKGRIQANLKLKILQRGVAAREQHPLTLFRGSSWSGASNGPTTLRTREKSRTEAVPDLEEQNVIADREAPRPPIISRSSPLENTSPASEENNEDGGRNLDPHPEFAVPSPVTSIESKDNVNSRAMVSDATGNDGHSEGSTSDIMGRDDESSDARTSGKTGKGDRISDARTLDTMGKDNNNSDSRMLEVMGKNDVTLDTRTSVVIGRNDVILDAWVSEVTGKNDVVLEGRASDTMGNNVWNSNGRTSDTIGKDDGNSDTRISNTMGEFVNYDDPNLERQQSMDACSMSSSWFEEEEEFDEELISESNYDWISRISRPRSYWEDRRQSWYKEMLEQESTKEDIRQLLQRRRVSNFLSSDFMEMMNDLMLRKKTNIIAQPEDSTFDVNFQIFPISRTDGCSTSHQEVVVSNQPMQYREEDAFQAQDAEHQDIAQVMDEHGNEEEQEQLDGEPEQEMVEEKGEGSDDQYRDASDHSHQSPLSSESYAECPRRPWGFNDLDDPVASISPARSPQSQAYYMDHIQHTRSMNHLSMEIELINELRGQMKQLQREMSKLRRSIKTCMDKQAPVHYSLKQEISPSARVDGRKRGYCSICYDKPVDSLLYRCGHMCTCLKCAVKLQFTSGKCPTCRAPIEDVVRTYPDSLE